MNYYKMKITLNVKVSLVYISYRILTEWGIKQDNNYEVFSPLAMLGRTKHIYFESRSCGYFYALIFYPTSRRKGMEISDCFSLRRIVN